jgi:hypothetical protein
MVLGVVIAAAALVVLAVFAAPAVPFLASLAFITKISTFLTAMGIVTDKSMDPAVDAE